VIVIDFKTSALTDGYPIEIAWARSGSECCAYLITPTAGPTANTRWDPVAESIRNTSRELLEQQGMPIDEVVANLIRDPTGERVLSDSPSHDWQWLQVLLEFSNIKHTLSDR